MVHRSVVSSIPIRRIAQFAALLAGLLLPGLLRAQTTASLTPASFNFGNQVENTTSSAEVFTLKNTGAHQLTGISISITGAFAQTHTCGTTLNSGKTCTISVTFTPTGTGTFSGTLKATDSATNSPQTASLSGNGINKPIPASFFSMDVNQNNATTDPWPGTGAASSFSFSVFRTLGSSLKWADVYDCTNKAYYFDENPTSNRLYTWANLSANQKMMFTAYYTPNCLVASAYQGDTTCAFSTQKAGCDLPGDIFTSTSCGTLGTIDDCTWATFISHLATYMNTNFPGQLGYIEVWNEPNVGSECNGNTGNCTQAALAQMVKDANTYGKGVISTVQIISPAVTAKSSGDCTVTAETVGTYLNGLFSQTPAIATYADYIGFHGYVDIPALETGGSGKPDPAVGGACENDLINNPTDGVRFYASQYTSKPLFDTEDSWGANCTGTGCLYLPDSWINGLTQTSSTAQIIAEQAAFTGQDYLIHATNALCPSTFTTCNPVAGFSWYGWDFDNQSTDPGSTGQFWDQWTNIFTSGPGFTAAGTAYKILYSWLDGASPVGPCSSTTGKPVGIWTCNFYGSGTSASLAVWDNSQSCVGTTTTPCTFSTYSFPANTYTEWRDLYGNTTQLSGATSVSIGLVPILLDNGTVPAAPAASTEVSAEQDSQ
jgi:hypothetical protein